MISKYRPEAPIVAVTYDARIQRQLALVWGVYPRLSQKSESTDEMLDVAVQEGVNSSIVTHGDLVVITAGLPVGETGTTNIMKIHVIGDVLAKGQGIGRKTAFGKAVIATSAKEALDKVNSGSILVTNATDRDMVPALEKCSALIVEEGGLTSHAAVVGLNIGIPVIVGVENATNILKDGLDITVDSRSGYVYSGHASVL